MIVLLDTSTATCKLTLVDGDQKFNYEVETGRELARDLLGILRDKLAEHGWTFDDMSALGVMKGPGSFTGLRIGLTVMNTIASDRQIPIVGIEDNENWRDRALERLKNGETDHLVMPYYGREAHITQQKK